MTPVPRSTVWASLDQPGTWEGVAGVDRITDAQIDEVGRLQGFSFVTLIAGSSYSGTAKSAARQEGHRIAWDIENPEISGSIQVTLTDADPGTEVGVDLTIASKGLLSTMFFPAIARTIGNGLPNTVEAFAGQFSEEE